MLGGVGAGHGSSSSVRGATCPIALTPSPPNYLTHVTGRAAMLAQAKRLGRIQSTAAPGIGRGRVNSAGPGPHPGVTSPWPSHMRVVLGYAGMHPAPIPGAVGVSRPIRPHSRLSRRRNGHDRLAQVTCTTAGTQTDGPSVRRLEPVVGRARSKSACSSLPGARPQTGRVPSRPGQS